MNESNDAIERYSYNIDLLYQLQTDDSLTEEQGEIISRELESLEPEIDKLVETNVDALRRMLIDPRPAVRLEGARKVSNKLPDEARATYMDLRKLKSDISVSAGFGLKQMDGKVY